jgi:hypothetical protein
MITLESISIEAKMRAPRILLLGVEKIGKTSFACGCEFAESGELLSAGQNSPIVLPVKGEEGADDLAVGKFPTLQTFAETLQAIGALYNEPHEFGTCVIDSVSALEPLVWQDVCQAHNADSIEQVGGGYGKGYTEALNRWRDLLAGLDALRAARNMATVLIGHAKVKRFDDPAGDSYDQYQLDLHDKAGAVLLRWADVILFANTKTTVKKEDAGFGKEKARGTDITGGKRFLYTQKRPAHPGGGRGVYGRLPYELPLSWTAFQSAITTATKEA